MPLVSSAYRPPIPFRQTDVNTIYAGTLRRELGVSWTRERFELSDGDFVDLDWLPRPESHRLAVLTHGLEGHARRPYMAGMAKAYHDAGFAVCAMNFRGCSGEPNRHLRSYHIGETGDLREVVAHALAQTGAQEAFLTGYSLGGNVVVKYLAEDPDAVPGAVRGAAVFSVPLFVADCNPIMNHARNWAYRWAFIVNLNRKAKRKARDFPEAGPYRRARKFDQFDEWYTAPWHGFESARHYWEANSSGPLLDRLRHPVLCVNADDDSFLHPSCYPREVAAKSDRFFLEIPDYGGHCGFVERNPDGRYYSDRRATEFARAVLEGRLDRFR